MKGKKKKKCYYRKNSRGNSNPRVNRARRAGKMSEKTGRKHSGQKQKV